MLLRLFTGSLVLIALVTVSSAQSKKSRPPVNKENLITALITSKNLPGRFGDDGVFVNTLLEDDPTPREVRRILKLGAKAIPLLIAHLDDTRLTRMRFCCSGGEGGEHGVTVGDASLDILRRIVVNAAPMFDPQCVKDRTAGTEVGEASCLEERFEFSPPSFSGRGRSRRPSREARIAKKNWQKAYANKKIRYQKY